jgi:SAM-dependent methyltransferase
MTVPDFFELFLEELRSDQTLWYYYKFLADPKKLGFRKAYFCQRLQYIMDHIGSKEQAIWDCGCGYGTTALFLAMNGYHVHGTTLEFYFREIEKRKQYWRRFGNVDLFNAVYEDIYSSNYTNQFDTILVQDTLHHLEPIDKALKVLHHALKNNGKLLVVEENGGNIIQNIKLIRQRGFNKVVEVYDESLQKTVVFGDENIRSLSQWKKILRNDGFSIETDSVEHIRLLPPASFASDYQNAIVRERKLVKKTLLRKYFYFGINFMAHKTNLSG